VIPLQTLQEIIARQAAIRTELDNLAALTEPEGDEAARSQAISDRTAVVDELLAEWDGLEEARKPLAARQERLDAVRSAASASPANRERGSFDAPQVMNRVTPFDGSQVRFMSQGDVRSRAMKVLEDDRGILNDANKTHLEQLFTRTSKNFDGDYIARRLLLTENPAYRSAFMKGTLFGHSAALNGEEAAAVAAFQDFEMRAASETNTAGGYGVPVFIDSTIILTSGAADAPILRIARIETITNNVWKGVSSAGVSWSFDAEGSAVSDDAATLAQPSVTAYMARGFIPYSIEIGQDYPGFAMEMSKLLNQGYIDLVASSSAVGSGSSAPRGIFTALDANTNVEVVTTTDAAFGGVDVFKVWNALPERYRSRATWFMSTSVESAIRQFAAATGGASAYFTVDLTQDGISRINGRPVALSDYAPNYTAGVPGTTGAANILTVGAFDNYLIAQRAGMSIEAIPMLFDVTANRPHRAARLVRVGARWGRFGK
jgi:HK97 family phage major capsid protein